MQAVQEPKPEIDSDAAELIRQLVSALLWPVCLTDAEATIEEQEEIQEQATRKIMNRQKQGEALAAESEQKATLAAIEHKTLIRSRTEAAGKRQRY